MQLRARGGVASRGEESGRDGYGEPRRVVRRAVLPSARATLGGLLMAVAGLGTLVAWRQASGTPDSSYLVADRAVDAGTRLQVGDVRRVPLELPPDVAAGALRHPEQIVGRVALGPLGENDLLQSGQLSADSAAESVREVSFSLPGDRAIDGDLQRGDWVDLFATYDDHTELSASRVQVVAVSQAAGSLQTDADVTVTLGLPGPNGVAPELIHAMRAGDVTLVRSTQAVPGGG